MNYSEQEESFFTQLNIFRADPQSLIPHLEAMEKLFKNDVLYRAGEIPIQTSEGFNAVAEAITFLRNNSQALPEFTRRKELDSASQDHANDIGAKGLVSHDGSDGTTVSERIERYAEWEGTCAENLDFGSKTGLNCLISLIVDDGVPSRGHRKNLMNPNLKFIGISAGAHKDYEVCLVVSMTGGIRDKDKPFYDYSSYKYQYPEDLTQKQEQKSKKIKNNYQLDDEDAPDDTVSVKTVKQTKLFEGKVHRVTKKFYTLSDGSTTIVEVEDI